jgi:hypothetical protein
MENIVYGFDADIFSIKVKTKKQRVTISQILKNIDCKHLSLEKVLTDGGNYFLFTYDTHPNLEGEDRPEWADWAQHSVNVHQLNHISINDWVSEGSDLANAMEHTHDYPIG